MDVRALSIDDVAPLVASIDRTEHVDQQFHVVDGRLERRAPVITEVPAWATTGTGPHTVAHQIEFCRQRILAGGRLFGAYDGDVFLGMAIVEPRYDGALARLAFLHVSRPHRRRGVASALWDATVDHATAAGAATLYVSATPTASAVGFYRSRGCTLAEPPHPALLAEEPDDIHLVLHLGA